MNHLANAIEKISIKSTEIQVLLHYLAHRHLSICKWKQLSAGLATTITCTTQQMSPTCTNILFYIMEGFLPMITMFCKQLVKANTTDINSKQIRGLLTAEGIAVLYSVGDGVMVSESPTQLEQDYVTPSQLLFSFTHFLALAMVLD